MTYELTTVTLIIIGIVSLILSALLIAMNSGSVIPDYEEYPEEEEEAIKKILEIKNEKK